jgi:transposase
MEVKFMEEKKKRGVSRKYTLDYKIEALKLVQKIGNAKASIELGVSKSTLSTWMKAAKIGDIALGAGNQTPGSAMTLAEENQKLKAEIKALTKANKLLAKENAFLEEASAFFAASRQKSIKDKE